MATLLDGIEEKHEGPEPRVLTEDVRRILARVIRPGDDDNGIAVAQIAEKADISTRTVYRILQGDRPTISLDLADRLVLAAGSHLAHCRLSWPDETVTEYIVG